MIVFFVARRAFETGEDEFKPRIVGASQCNAPQSFHKSGEQSSGFRGGFFPESFHRTAAELLRQLVRPQRLEDGNELVESRSDRTPCRGLGKFQTSQIIQHDVPRFTPRSVRASVDELAERLLQSGHRNAPDLRPTHNGRFFPRGQLQPKAVDQLLAMLVRCPGERERRKVLRGMRTVVSTGLHEHVREPGECRPDPGRV